jgi:hypothetical protein
VLHSTCGPVNRPDLVSVAGLKQPPGSHCLIVPQKDQRETAVKLRRCHINKHIALPLPVAVLFSQLDSSTPGIDNDYREYQNSNYNG